MPGISTTGVYQQVRRMTIPIANWTGAAVSGAAGYPGLNTLHGLTDGRLAPTAPATYPSWAAEQLDGFRAWVVLTSGATYGDVEAWISFPDYTPAAATDRVSVIVAASLVDECFARFAQDPPLRVEIRALFKSPHSIEGRGTDDSEGFPAAPLGSLLAVPRGYGDSSTPEIVYVSATTGLDTNDGHTAPTAWHTMGRVKTYMEFVATFQHSLQVVCDADPVAVWDAAHSNFAPENVTFVGESRLSFTGHPPVRDATNQNADKTLTVAVGVALADSPRDCDHFRLTPQNNENWMDNQVAPAAIALTAADIGKTIRFADATHVGYATLSGVCGLAVPGAGNRWVECNINHPLLAVPAWVTAVGTIWTILDHTDPAGQAAHADAQVTAMAGTWVLSGIRSTAGSALQTDTTPEKQNCISHIRFTGSVTLQDCDRFAFPGCRFEGGLRWYQCRDITCYSNAVADNAANRYFSSDIWTAQGFVPVGTNQAFGGMGFFVDTTTVNNALKTARVQCICSNGLISGMVGTGVTGAPHMGCTYFRYSNAVMEWCSFGPDMNDLARVYAEDNSNVAITNGRLTCQLRADYSSTVTLLGPNSFLARAINVADDVPVIGEALSYVTADGVDIGLLRASDGGTIQMLTTTGTDQEGIAAETAGLGVLVSIGQGCKFIATGGHDANLFGNSGWLWMSGASTGYMSGNRVFAHKHNGAESNDIYIYNATLQTGPLDTWTKNHGADAGDQTASPVIRLDHHANFKLGTPVSSAPAGMLVAGLPVNGNGIRCGANGIVRIQDGSSCTIADFHVNNENACPAIVLSHRSFLHFTGENINSYIEIDGAAANAVVDGSITIGAPVAGGGFLPAGELAVRGIHSDHLALLGTAQLTYIRHE